MPKFRVLNPEISYPTDPAIIARLLKGEDIPLASRGMVSYRAGAIVEDVPACSIPHLLGAGAIEPADDDDVTTVDPIAREHIWADLGRPDDVEGGQ